MPKRLTMIGVLLLFSIGAAHAQTPSPEAMSAARSLVATLKLTDQYKALLPVILLNLKPVLAQDRPEIEQDYDAMLPRMEEAYRPYSTRWSMPPRPSMPAILPWMSCAK